MVEARPCNDTNEGGRDSCNTSMWMKISAKEFKQWSRRHIASIVVPISIESMLHCELTMEIARSTTETHGRNKTEVSNGGTVAITIATRACTNANTLLGDQFVIEALASETRLLA